MSSKKGKFAKKAHDILPDKESVSIADFLDGSGEDNNIYQIPIELIKDNPYQPRQNFDKDQLDELAESIKQHGILQPILVRKDENEIILVAGERRLRAAKLLTFEKVPAIITQGNALEISLIENIIRADLDPFEEADALQKMIEEYKYTQENLAKVIGKGRTSISRSLGLNKIPEELKAECARVHIPKRTLIEISRLETVEAMTKAVNNVINFDFTAEDIRAEAKEDNKDSQKKKEAKNHDKPDSMVVALRKTKSFHMYIGKFEATIEENGDGDGVLEELTELKKKLEKLIKKLNSK